MKICRQKEIAISESEELIRLCISCKICRQKEIVIFESEELIRLCISCMTDDKKR